MHGVAQVQIWGEQKPAIRIQVDPAKLASAGLTLEDVRPMLVNSTTIASKGTVNTAETSFTIAANDQIIDAEPFNDAIVAYRNGGPIRVRDIGRAVAGPTDNTIGSFQNGKRGILLVVYKQPGANVIDTVDQIRVLLPRLIRNIPPGIKVEVVQDRTGTIRSSVRDVEFTLALTIILVVMVILLFLRNFWATVIPGITVPLALLGSAAMMYLLGFSLDNLSLMALTIAVGFVVDDAIVVVENIHRHIEDGEAPFEAALNGAREIGFTVLSISMSLIAVFIPLLLMGGIIGRLFREFALTVTASIAVSALVSLTLAPMLCSRFMRPESHHHGRIYRFIEAGFDAMLSFYRSTLDIVLRHQAITLGVFFATMVLTGAMMYYTPKGFFPIQDIDLISGICGGLAGRFAPEDDKPGGRSRPDHPQRSGRRQGSVTSFGPSFGSHRKHRTFERHTQAARGARSRCVASHRPPASATCQNHRVSQPIFSPRRTLPSAAALPGPRSNTHCRIRTSKNSPNGRRSY